MKPHIDKARILLQPYTKRVHRHYRNAKKTVSLYHHQAQENIHHMLKNHHITKPYATKELAWYLASALLALPVIFLVNLVSDFGRKKPKKHSHRHHTSHTRRRAKRAHSDKWSSMRPLYIFQLNQRSHVSVPSHCNIQGVGCPGFWDAKHNIQRFWISN